MNDHDNEKRRAKIDAAVMAIESCTEIQSLAGHTMAGSIAILLTAIVLQRWGVSWSDLVAGGGWALSVLGWAAWVAAYVCRRICQWNISRWMRKQ